MKPVGELIRAAVFSFALTLPLAAVAGPGRAPHAAVIVGHEVVYANGAHGRHVTTFAVNGRSHIFWGPVVSGVLDAVFNHQRHHPAAVSAQVYLAAAPPVAEPESEWAPPPTPPPPPPVAAPAPAPEPAATASTRAKPETTLGLIATGGPSGGEAGLTLRVEGRRFGVNTAFSVPSVRDEYLARSMQGLSLFEARMTWSMLSGESGRLRLEAGFSSQLTKRVGTLGFDSGVSAELRLFGPVGVEASSYYTAYPHRRFDGRAGATLKLGSFGLQAGLRNLWIQPIVTTGDLGEQAFVRGPYFAATYTF